MQKGYRDCYDILHFAQPRHTAINMVINAVDSIRLFRFVCKAAGGQSRQNLILYLGSGERCGWGECAMLSRGDPAAEADLSGFYGRTASECFELIRSLSRSWHPAFREMAELALLDLQGHIEGRSALELLSLDGVKPVLAAPSVYSREASRLPERAFKAYESGAKAIKIRLSGNADSDLETVISIRKLIPRENMYLIGCAAGAYSDALDFSVEKLGVRLLKMYTAGLDFCEDPAVMEPSDWRELQSFVDPLPLAAERLLCPVRRALTFIDSDVCRVFKLRPGLSGSVFDISAFTDRVRSFDREIAVGDGGLIGPGCSQWQQLAVGLSAKWVEAVERSPRSDPYSEALRSSPLMLSEGMYALAGGAPGFGLDIDARVLELYADETTDI